MDVMESRANSSSGLKEIEIMDAVLELKATQKEGARMSRVQFEENSVCSVINFIECDEVPEAIKKNLSCYLELTNGLQSINAGNHKKKKNPEEVQKNSTKRKTQNLFRCASIIEKNRQLSICGMGTLSVTDQEKDRINCILAEEGTFVQEENGFRPDAATIAVLKRIDCKLRANRREAEVEKAPPVTRMNDRLLKNRLREIDKILDAFQAVSAD